MPGLMTLLLFGVIVSVVYILIQVTRIDERTKNMPQLWDKVTQVEGMVESHLEDFTDDDLVDTGETMFISKDGKYSAPSLPELIRLMAAGGDLEVPQEDVNALTDFFNTAADSIEDVNMDEGEDGWKS